MNTTRVCKTLSILSTAFAVVGFITIGSPAALAQNVFSVNYFSNANTPGLPDATLRIDNPGVAYTKVCAMTYVFDADQQLSECCGCVETPDGLRTLSVNNDLTSNPLTGVKSTNGVIKIVSAPFLPPDPCDPAGPYIAFAHLQAWMTHIFPTVTAENAGNLHTTETEFSPSPLGATELAALQSQCLFIHVLGSGHGICTCGTGD